MPIKSYRSNVDNHREEIVDVMVGGAVEGIKEATGIGLKKIEQDRLAEFLSDVMKGRF